MKRQITLVNDGSWHHIVGNYHNGIMEIYVDGKLENFRVQDLTGTTLGVPGNFFIGNRGHHYRGNLDEHVIFNDSLTANEVKKIYNSQFIQTLLNFNRHGPLSGTVSWVIGKWTATG